jgi:thiamine-phosphate pyrophosphorylase
MKNLFPKNRKIYLISDRTVASLSHSRIASFAISSGIRTIQLREKQMSKRAIFKEAVYIRKITAAHGATFIVNDYIDIALAVDADGVHLGQEDMPVKDARKIMGRGKIIGISTHTLRQAVLAQESGADYIGFGPMFHTTTKNAGSPKGLGALRKIRNHITIPIVAIGGITGQNINEVLEAGADACAIASGILSGDMKKNINSFIDTIA